VASPEVDSLREALRHSFGPNYLFFGIMTAPFENLKYLNSAGKLMAHQIATADRNNLSIERLLNVIGDLSQRISALEDSFADLTASEEPSAEDN
jgi:hypothetical protein